MKPFGRLTEQTPELLVCVRHQENTNRTLEFFLNAAELSLNSACK